MNTETALANEWLRLALQSAKAVAWDWEIESGAWACFGDLGTIFGISSETMSGTIEDFRRWVHPDDRGRVRDLLERALRNRHTFTAEFRIAWQNGTVRWTESRGSFQYSANGEPERMLGMAMDITDRRATQVDRQVSEQRFSQFFATLQEYGYIVTPQGQIADVNASACEALGYRKEELAGKPLSTIYAPEWHAKMRALLEEWEGTGELRNEEMVIVTKSGEKRTVLVSVGAVRDTDGKVLHSTSVQTDITERKRIEEGLRESEERLRLAAKAGRMYAFEWNPATDEVFRSEECASVLGLEEEPQWTTAREFFLKLHPDDRPAFLRLIERLNPESNTYRTTYRLCRPGQEPIWLEENGHAFFDKGGRLLRLVGMVADINARQAAEEKLQESEKLSRQIVLGSPVAMVVTRGPQQKCELVNDKFTALFGYTIEDMPDEAAWWPLAYPDEAYREAIRREWRTRVEAAIQSRSGIEPMEATVTCADGSTKDVEFHFSNLGDTSLVSFVDITERKRAEKELLQLHDSLAQMNRMASMGQMLASLAHELGQPLTALLSNAQAAERFACRPKPDLEEIRSALADITEDGTRAGAILHNLRAMFRKHPTTPHAVDLNQIVHDVLRLVQNEARLRGVQLTLELPSHPVGVRGDEIPLEQVLVNLITNGMEAMEHLPAEQRILTVRTALRTGNGCGIIRVEDHGPGIAEQDRAKLFTPFYSTKNNGLGIGLSICQAIVHSLGGRITYQGRSEQGAAFEVELPACTDAKEKGRL